MGRCTSKRATGGEVQPAPSAETRAGVRLLRISVDALGCAAVS